MASPADGEQDNQQDTEHELQQDTPPFFASWGRLYGAVIIYLAAFIVFLYLFTEYYKILT